MPATSELSFDEHCRRSVHRLRGALLDLYREVGADPARPQEVSRQFGVNRNLAWKVARILKEESALDVVPLIPRPGGLDILLDAMQNAGASAHLVNEARDAFEAFDAMVEIHVGDRAALELVLDSMGRGSQKPLEMSRKLAFRGASGLWGVQVGSRVTAQFLAPSRDDPNMCDAAQIAGLSRVRRFRPIPRWPVFRLGKFTGSDRPAPIDGREPIDPACAEHPGLIPEFCEGERPELFSTQRGEGLYYEIGDGPIGKRGEFTLYFGHIQRNYVWRYARSSEGVASLVAAVTMPAEVLLFDLFVHRDLAQGLTPQCSVFGKLWEEGGTFDASARLPIEEEINDLGRGVRVDTSLVPRYDELVSRVFQRAGWNAGEFHCFRLVLDYPPMSSVVAMNIRLPRE